MSDLERRKPPYQQGYEDGLADAEFQDSWLYDSEKDQDHYGEGYNDAQSGQPNKLGKS